jgi:hypothetical protein
VIGATREEFKVEQQENAPKGQESLYHQVSKLEHFLFNFNDGVVGKCWEDRLSKSTAVSLRQRASSDSQVRGTDVVFHPVE